MAVCSTHLQTSFVTCFAGATASRSALLFFDPDAPDPWLQVAKRDIASLGKVEDVEEQLIASCERAGLKIVFVATDGDRVADKRHTAAFHLYAEWLERMTLSEILARLEQAEAGGRPPYSIGFRSATLFT